MNKYYLIDRKDGGIVREGNNRAELLARVKELNREHPEKINLGYMILRRFATILAVNYRG